MPATDQVRASRDGDQFHYYWAARHCLQLLPGGTDLVAVTIEGPSTAETQRQAIEEGAELIDVGFYYGAEEIDRARLVNYVQLKHSTLNSLAEWTASGLKKTLEGFSERYAKLVARLGVDDVASRFRFEFTTNRPIAADVREALLDLASGSAARHPSLENLLLGYAGLSKAVAQPFFALFTVTGGEGDLWTQRNLLTVDIRTYLPDADYETPVQLKELVTRKATTEFEADPSIRRHDVLRALKVTEEQLAPAPALIDVANTLPREQEASILQCLMQASGPLVIHAEGGVGKSVLAGRLAASMPSGSEAVLYDCFGDGRYRNAMFFRHRHRDGLVQIANELAARGLCHPLIPSQHADATQYMRAFVGRITEAITLLRARDSTAQLCLIIDAADNAEMAAEELHERSFVRDLIRAPLPDGVHVAFTCRTHRRERLNAPPDAAQVELCAYSDAESKSYLRTLFPDATDAESSEFRVLSCANPRVQWLALTRARSETLSLHDTLKELGPEPTTVERAINELLDRTIARLRDEASVEGAHIEILCQCLAVLRPLVPVPVIAALSGISESAVRSFALDFGRPLFLRGNSIHFLDEPTETWFRERFLPVGDGLRVFVDRLRPLTAKSAYAAAALPQLLLQAGLLDELVRLALSNDSLPTENPLERREVKLQRVTFALGACLQERRYAAAAKLALLAGGECAGERRQNRVIQDNTDVAAVLMAPDRISDIVARRVFGTGWMGSHHAYDAGLLSGRPEFAGDGSSHLRMAQDWLSAWARRPRDDRRDEEVTDDDLAEIAIALLRLRGARQAARFLRGWTPREVALLAGREVARRMIDLGDFDRLDELAVAAGSDVWLVLGLATEACAVGRQLPLGPLERLRRLLADRRVKLPESDRWDERWTVLDAVRSAAEIGTEVAPHTRDQWGEILRRYLPSAPPHGLASRFESDRPRVLRAYALDAALRGARLQLTDVTPAEIREGGRTANSYEAALFQQHGEALLKWFAISAEITCGRAPLDLQRAIDDAVTTTAMAESRMSEDAHKLRETVAIEWLRLLRKAGATDAANAEKCRTWLLKVDGAVSTTTLIALCRFAARTEPLKGLAMTLAGEAHASLSASREDANARAASYLRLARAVLVVSPSEAKACFDRAVEISSRIGDENLERWAALLHLANAAAERNNPRPRSAYGLSRVAELVYEYVERDKHFNWNGTVKALTNLCPTSALAILSRWRERRFGNDGHLLPIALYQLIGSGRLPNTSAIALAGLTSEWEREADLKRALEAVPDATTRAVLARVAYRYMRLLPSAETNWSAVVELRNAYGLVLPDLDRLAALERARGSSGESASTAAEDSPSTSPTQDWNHVFHGVVLTDSASLRSALAVWRNGAPPYDRETFFREAWSRVPVGREPDFIRAAADGPDFGVFDLLDLLKALPAPPPPLLSVRHAIRDVVLETCRREPHHVYRRAWFGQFPFDKLNDDGIATAADIIGATLEGFSSRVEFLGASEFFQLIDPLAGTLSAAEAEDVLEFGMALLEDVLQPTDGDGPWREALQAPSSIVESLAGYVWAGLGSPVVAERWQFAHVVRGAVEIGWSDFLDALISRASTGSPGAFVDQGLAFYGWHARQWLLVGLARGALERPAAVRAAIPLLLVCLREGHVIMRDLAAQVLRTLLVDGSVDGLGDGELDAVNRSTLPEAVYSWARGAEETPSPDDDDDEEDDDERYYFGIDIGPYWFAGLGNAFGLSQEEIERRARTAIRSRLGWNRKLGWREDERHARKIFDESETSHSHGSLPRTDDLTAYHAYHAMMMVAADLLGERSVRRRAEDPVDEFREWFARYQLTRSDGRWLADRRSPRLAASSASSRGRDWPWSVTAPDLDRQLTTDDEMKVLWGHWTNVDGEYNEEIHVRSALVSRVGAEALLAALQTSPRLDRLVLPFASGDDDERIGVGPLALQGWVALDDQSARLDERDPWGSKVAYPGPSPSPATIRRLGLTKQGDDAWVSGSEGIVRSEAWSHVEGYGRELDTIPGARLSADTAFLKSLLDAHAESTLILSVEIRRRAPRYARDESVDTYAQPYLRYYLMGADGVATPF